MHGGPFHSSAIPIWSAVEIFVHNFVPLSSDFFYTYSICLPSCPPFNPIIIPFSAPSSLHSNYQFCSGPGLGNQGECRTAQTLLKLPLVHLPMWLKALRVGRPCGQGAPAVVSICFSCIVLVQVSKLFFVEGQIANNLGFG